MKKTFLCLALLGSAGCIGYPVSRTTTPGATIAVPVSGERLLILNGVTEYASAYGYTGNPDPQRGTLTAVMCPVNSTSNMSACLSSSQKQFLTVRYMTRLYPDRASRAGIENLDDTLSDPNGNLISTVYMSGQVLAFLDIPASLDATLFGNCTLSPPPASCTTKLTYTLYLGTTSDTTSLQAAGVRNIELVHGSGTANSQAVLYYSASPPLSRFVPYPKVVFAVNTAGQQQVAAAELTISAPTSVTIKDVIEEENLGQHTMVRWTVDPPQGGTQAVRVQLVSPEAKVDRIAVVFSLNSGQTPPLFSAFTVTQSTIYGTTGATISGAAFAATRIR